jgi:hypothetical protein
MHLGDTSAGFAWGSVAEWVSGLGSLGAVIVALLLVRRDTRREQERSRNDHNGLVDFAIEILRPLCAPPKDALEAQAEIDRLVGANVTIEEIKSLDFLILPALRQRRTESTDEWSTLFDRQSRLFNYFRSVALTKDPVLASALTQVALWFEDPSAASFMSGIEEPSKVASSLTKQLQAIRNPPG